jgi:hypothetical protein
VDAFCKYFIRNPTAPAGYLTCSAFILRTREAGDDIIQPIQSARIVEVRAKMPKGDWIWPGKKCTYLRMPSNF